MIRPIPGFRVLGSVLGSMVLLVGLAVGTDIAAAHAEVIGTVSFSPVAGEDVHPMSAFTSAPCPRGTHLMAKIYGAGFPPEGVNGTSNSRIALYAIASNGGLEVPLLNTMRTFADQQHPSATLQGKYDFVITCKMQAGQQSLGDYKGSITFTSPTNYTSGDGKTQLASRMPQADGDPRAALPSASADLNAAPSSAHGAAREAAPEALAAGGGSSNGSNGSRVWLIGLGFAAVAALSFGLGRRRSRNL